MEIRKIKIQDIVPNEGQIPGLPSNPRQWTKDEMENLKKSLQETPELFEARGVIVYPHDGKFIVLGGNMRLSASKALKFKEVPCIVVPEETPVQKLKEIVIKDNGSFGEWDFDLLANEWDDLALTDWGVPAWSSSGDIDYGSLEIEPVAEKGKSVSGLESITFIFSQEDATIVKDYIARFTKESITNKIIEICRNPEVK